MTTEKMIGGLLYLSTNNRIKLVHGVLKSLHISPLQDNYDDLLQEGCIIFAQAFQQFPDDHEENERALMNFAYKRIYWRILDQLRRQTNERSHWIGSLNDDALDETTISRLSCDPHSQDRFAQLENGNFFRQLEEICSTNERRYLHAVLFADLKDSEIAQQYAVSRQAVYSWKRGLIRKAHSLNWHK